METVSTIIEFAESINPVENVIATGDFLGIAMLIVSIVFGIFAAGLLMFRKKSLVNAGTISTFGNKGKTFLISAATIVLLVLGLVFCVSRANASGTSIAQASDKVYALVDPETGEVAFENGYIKSTVPADVNSVAVKVDLLDEIELTYNFNWQIKIGDEVIYDGIAKDLKHDFYIDVKDAQTSFEITNLSVSDAKALIGKEVAKISFCTTTLKKIQSDAYFKIYDTAEASLDTISTIPATSLLDEDRAEVESQINKILDICLKDISSTEDPDELQTIVLRFNSQIIDITNNAKEIAEQTLAEKQAFIDKQNAKVEDLKTIVAQNDLLTAEDKEEFNNQFDILVKQDIPYINNITSKFELELKESDIINRLNALAESIYSRIDQRLLEYKENAVKKIEKMNADGIADINEIDNLSEAKKGSYIALIQEACDSIKGFVVDLAKTKSEVDEFVIDCSNVIALHIEEAEATAHRPWILDTWSPDTEITVTPGSDILLTEKAKVSDYDPYGVHAPKPEYFISQKSFNNDLFSITTTADGYAKLLISSSAPIGNYSIDVYAQFASVPDYGYVTKTDAVTLNINVSYFTEIVLQDKINTPIGWSGDGQVYLLSDGGKELTDNNAKPGDIINLYFSEGEGFPDYIAQIWEGHWGWQFEEINKDNYDLVGHGWKYSITLTEELLDVFTTQQWWGGVVLVQGQSLYIEKVTLTSFVPFEKTLGDYSADPLIADDWGQGAFPQPIVFSDGGKELKEAGAKVGDYINFYLNKMPDTQSGEYWLLEIMEGHWNPLLTYVSLCESGYPWPEGRVEYNLDEHNGVFSLKITQEMLDYAYTEQGYDGVFALNGDNTMCTKITLSNFSY